MEIRLKSIYYILLKEINLNKNPIDLFVLVHNCEHFVYMNATSFEFRYFFVYWSRQFFPFRIYLTLLIHFRIKASVLFFFFWSLLSPLDTRDSVHTGQTDIGELYIPASPRSSFFFSSLSLSNPLSLTLGFPSKKFILDLADETSPTSSSLVHLFWSCVRFRFSFFSHKFLCMVKYWKAQHSTLLQAILGSSEERKREEIR